MRAAVLLPVLVACLVGVTPAHAADWYVDEQDTSTDEPAGTPADPYSTRTGIQDAIDDVTDGDVIHVAGGSYANFALSPVAGPGGTWLPGENVVIKKDNTSWSPPSGATGDVFVEPGTGPEAVDSNMPGIYIDGAQTSATRIENLIVRNWDPTLAAAVSILPIANNFDLAGASPKIIGCTMRDNDINTLGLTGGAGMLIGPRCNPEITNCVFINNRIVAGNGYGGALWVYGALIGDPCPTDLARFPDPVISGCTFRDNLATHTSQNLGGAISFDCSKGSVINCSFSRNKASNYGGAILANHCDGLRIEDCTFQSNSVTNVDGEGAAVAVLGMGGNNGRIRIAGCGIRASTANGGGALIVEDADVSIHHNTFSGNTTSGTGAFAGTMALLAEADSSMSALVVNNLIYSSNVTDAGGADCDKCAVWCSTEATSAGLEVTFVNNTIARNSVRAISLSHFESGAVPADLDVEVLNCILWDNGTQSSPSVKSDCGPGTPALAVAWSDTQQSFTGLENLSTDPLFVSAFSYHLLGTSPCVNAGYNGFYTDATSTDPAIPNLDLDDADRFVGTPETIDMGAYEYQGP